MAMAKAASSTVAGSVCAISPATRSRCWIDWPKSRCSVLRSHTQYCTAMGRSKPISWRICSISTLVALGGTAIASGSAGISRSTVNSRIDTTKRIGIAVATRCRSTRTTSLSIANCGTPPGCRPRRSGAPNALAGGASARIAERAAWPSRFPSASRRQKRKAPPAHSPPAPMSPSAQCASVDRRAGPA